jgi:hypothetical protein
MQILVVNMTMSIHLVKKIEARNNYEQDYRVEGEISSFDCDLGA